MGNDIMEEVREIIDKTAGYQERAKIIFDKKQKQYSVKIPKKVADKAELDQTKQEFLFEVILERDEHGSIIKKLEISLVDKDA